jgi:hypothetical protein
MRVDRYPKNTHKIPLDVHKELIYNKNKAYRPLNEQYPADLNNTSRGVILWQT